MAKAKAAPEEKKKKKWGEIGAPSSKKRAAYLAGIRKNKRNTKQQREAEAEKISKEDIELIESKTMDLDLEDKGAAVIKSPVVKAKAVADVEIKEREKIEAPGEPGEPYVVYPY